MKTILYIIGIVLINCTNLFAQTPTISGVINTYLRVKEMSDYGRKIYVSNASAVNVGDWLLLIQNQGAATTSTDECNGPTGSVTSYDAAGNFELVRVKAIETSPPPGPYELLDGIELESPIRRFYYAHNHSGYQIGYPNGNNYGFQVVVVPYYEGDVEITGTLTADPWDGEKGGVVALVAEGTVTMKANIDVSGKGFRGGVPSANNSSIDQIDYVSDPANNYAARKGEGISDVAIGNPEWNSGRVVFEESAGRGALANGGGGGNGKNAGGGGGSNYAAGGRGGNQNSTEDSPGTGDDEEQKIGGEGGWALNYEDERRTQVFFGGGGGGGHRSNDNGSTPDDSKGGVGGGIVLILADKISVDNGNPTGRFIMANGANGTNADAGANGAGGGGGGGTILLDVNQILNPGIPSEPLVLQVAGGDGGNTSTTTIRTGPGGGGGGGLVWFRAGTTPSGVEYNTGNGTVSGGAAGESNNGVINNNHGAEDGEDGTVLHNLTYPKWYGPGESAI